MIITGCSSGTTSNKQNDNTVFGNISKIREASGIGYCTKTKTLFVAGDNGILYEINKEGNILKSKNFSTLKNHDFEGIAYDEANDELAVAVEGSDNLLLLTTDLVIKRTINIERTDDSGRLILEKDKENGLEGIAIKNGDIYLSNQSFKRLPDNDPSVLIKIDFISSDAAKISEVIDHKYLNISGLTFHKGFLYMVTDSGDLLIKYDLDKKQVIKSYKITEFDKSLKDISLEGVTFDDIGNVYFADDNGGKIYKFKFNE